MSLNERALIIQKAKQEDAIRDAIAARRDEPALVLIPPSASRKSLFSPSKPHLSVTIASTEAQRRKMQIKSVKLTPQTHNLIDLDPKQNPEEFQRVLDRAEELRREEQLQREAEIRKV